LNKLADLYHKSGQISDMQYLSEKNANIEAILKAETTGYDKQIAALVAFENKDEKTRAGTQSKIDEIWAKRAAAVQRSSDDEKLLNAQVLASIIEVGDKEIKSLDEAIMKQAKHNDEIGKTKAQIDIIEKAYSNLTLMLNIAEEAQLNLMISMGTLSPAEVTAAQARIAILDEEIKKRGILAAFKDAGESKDAAAKAAADQKTYADMTIQYWKDVGAEIESSLSGAFGNVGKSMGDMFKAYDDYAAKQEKINKDLEKSIQLAQGDPDQEAKIAQARIHASDASSRARGQYSSIVS